MAEALGLTASIITVLQITNSVISLCCNYGAALHGTSWEASQVRKEMESLRDVLQTLEPLATEAELSNAAAETRLSALFQICKPDGLLAHCLSEVKCLDERLKPPGWSDGLGPKRKALIQALRWPLKEAETRKTLENIQRFKSTLDLAINMDQAKLALAIEGLALSTNDVVLETQEDMRLVKDKTLDIYRVFQSAQLGSHHDEIHRWLSPPDPSTNHNRACRTRQATTGSWFLDSKRFTRWRENKSLLWLHGKAGCGKTVLSSTIIETLNKDRSKSEIAVVYFYFDFNDVDKQKSDKMIRSLISQLLSQLMMDSKESGSTKPSRNNFKELESTFSNCSNGKGQPNSEQLMTILKEIFDNSDEIYVILDALDECSDREELINKIMEIQEWGFPYLHMLLTSRRLPDIEEMLDEILINPQDKICIQSALVDADIAIYVHKRLKDDRKLQRWRNKPDVQEEIKLRLMEKADGMFRWAVCQLDALQDCLNLPKLRKALDILPKTLDETYARILSSIPEDQSQDAIKILQWLTFSKRPVGIDELAEVIAVNENGNPWFDREARFPEKREILKICSSLVTTEINGTISDYDAASDYSNLNSGYQIVRLAHFSVKEYLISERIQHQAPNYAVQEISSHRFIATTCLAYLLQFDQHDTLNSRTIKDFPLAQYAAVYWTRHTQKVGKDLGLIKDLCIELFLVNEPAYINCCRLYNPEFPWESPEFDKGSADFAKPLHYMSWMGAVELVQLVLDCRADTNVQSGPYDANALQAASFNGHEAVVRLLLDRGADINVQSGDFDKALRAASDNGHVEVVRLLLDRGADINAQSGYGGNVLQMASWGGHVQVVRFLLDRGANINAQGGIYGNALQAASFSGHVKVVRLLLDRGANINAQGGVLNSALQAASTLDHEPVVWLLLDRGADINVVGPYSNSLKLASASGHDAVVRLLLDRGADINVAGPLDDELEAAPKKGVGAVYMFIRNSHQYRP